MIFQKIEQDSLSIYRYVPVYTHDAYNRDSSELLRTIITYNQPRIKIYLCKTKVTIKLQYIQYTFYV